jgi:hypothetical protein
MVRKNFALHIVSLTFLFFLTSVSVSATGLFKPAQIFGTGGSPGGSVAVADLNGDGIPDVAVTNGEPNSDQEYTVGVLLGNGDGTFQPAQTYGTGGVTPRQVIIADVNGDGNPDLVIVNQCGLSSTPCSNVEGTVGVLLGNGDGTFQAAKAYHSGGGYANGIAVGDVNGDGNLDLVVANSCTGETCQGPPVVAVLLGDGTGAFVKAHSYGSGGYLPSSITLADVNGDGKLDVLAVNQCTGPRNESGCASGSVVGVLLGKGDGTFKSARTYKTGGWQATGLVAADVNGDGKPDLVVANGCTTGSIEGCGSDIRGVVGVLLGNGDGTFQDAQTFDTDGEYAMSVAAADVNGDGKLDLVVANSCAAGYFSKCYKSGVGVLMGNGDGTFQPATSYLSGGYEVTSIAVADLSGDGKPDVLTGNAAGTPGSLTGGVMGVLWHK